LTVTEGPGERFGLTWPGRAECLRVIGEPPTGTLEPMPAESVDWATTGNVIVEGDNLEVLKLLARAYHGAVKLITIDPPYNTGREFLYPDDFADPMAAYLRYSGQVDDLGRRANAAVETAGRRHSRWLSMMYPRLVLARELLRPDGAIFVTIDDTEVAHLRLIMDEIWGEENFVATVAWQKVFAKKNRALISGSHDHVLVYARDVEAWDRRLLPRGAAQEKAFGNPDDDPRGPWQSVSFSVRSEGVERAGTYRYPVTLPSGREVWPPAGRHWNGDRTRYEELRADGRIWFGRDGDHPPRVKGFRSEVQAGIVPDTWWRHDETGHNQEAKREVVALFGADEPFTTPKPTRLVRRMLQIGTGPGDLVLDFFAGSGTLGHAVYAENLGSGEERRFVLVQLPEPTPGTAYASIAEVTRERVRRAGAALRPGAPAGADLGFRAYRLVAGGGADLTGLMLAAGHPLTAPVEEVDLAGVPGWSVAGGALLACLGPLTAAAVEAMLAREPAVLAVTEEGFGGDDALRLHTLHAVRERNRRGVDLALQVV
jgi:adenine-specific DNA-methyltransferase